MAAMPMIASTPMAVAMSAVEIPAEVGDCGIPAEALVLAVLADGVV